MLLLLFVLLTLCILLLLLFIVGNRSGVLSVAVDGDLLLLEILLVNGAVFPAVTAVADSIAVVEVRGDFK